MSDFVPADLHPLVERAFHLVKPIRCPECGAAPADWCVVGASPANLLDDGDVIAQATREGCGFVVGRVVHVQHSQAVINELAL